MFEIFQKEISIGRIACICYVFFLRQKLDLLNSMIDLENFACLNRALVDVHDFLLVEEEEKEEK